jgi:cobalamin biosynthesis Mg chelatase CobN
VAEHAQASGSLALSRRPRDTARTLPRTMIGSPAFSAASVLPRRPAEPAEIAQARLFERLLQAECAELQELAHRMAGDKYQQPQPEDSRPSGELAQVRARMDEVHGLLRALQGRFPHSVPDGDRYPA